MAFQPLAGKDDITSYEENTRPYLEACYLPATGGQMVAFSTTEKKQHGTQKVVVCTPLKFKMEPKDGLKTEVPFGNHQISDICLAMPIFPAPKLPFENSRETI